MLFYSHCKKDGKTSFESWSEVVNEIRAGIVVERSRLNRRGGGMRRGVKERERIVVEVGEGGARARWPPRSVGSLAPGA